MPKASERVEGRSRRDQKFLRQAYKLKFKLPQKCKNDPTDYDLSSYLIQPCMYLSVIRAMGNCVMRFKFASIDKI